MISERDKLRLDSVSEPAFPQFLDAARCQEIQRTNPTVTRIFLTLASVSTLLLLTVFVLGLNIDDPKTIESQALVSWHLMLALTGLVVAALVHAIVLTYFMGTGRWMEEVSKTYQLDDSWRQRSQKLKYRVIPWMFVGILLLLTTIGFGAAADPASRMGFSGWAGISASTLHLLVAFATVGVNVAINVVEFQSIERNGQLVQDVLEKVREIRTARGLPM